MTGVVITIRETGVDRAAAILGKLDSFNPTEMLAKIARLIQIQTQRRIEDEKRGPNGEAWAKNAAGTPILRRSGELSRSIDFAVNGNQIMVGSGLVYSAIHQYGGTIVPKTARALAFRIGNAFVVTKKVQMPARPYLGISDADASEIIDEVTAYIRRLIG